MNARSNSTADEDEDGVGEFAAPFSPPPPQAVNVSVPKTVATAMYTDLIDRTRLPSVGSESPEAEPEK